LIVTEIRISTFHTASRLVRPQEIHIPEKICLGLAVH
jgi:hypothetical protein